MASVCLTPRNYQKQYQLQHEGFTRATAMLQQQQQHLQHATHLHGYQTQQQQQQLQQQQQHQLAATLQQLPFQRPTKFTKIAPSNNNNNNNNIVQGGQKTARPTIMMMAKKGCPYAGLPFGEQLPSVARRNARERNRVKQVNNGFANLRQHLPQTVINALSNGGRGASKKLSKVDTLRIAVEYIRGLEQLLQTTNTNASTTNTITTNLLQTDESSNDDSNYTNSSIGSPIDIHNYPQLSQSPTPSYSDSSDISINGANSFVQPLKFEDVDTVSKLTDDFQFDSFDEFQQLAADEQPDDEELLDYISSWQDE